MEPDKKDLAKNQPTYAAASKQQPLLSGITFICPIFSTLIHEASPKKPRPPNI